MGCSALVAQCTPEALAHCTAVNLQLHRTPAGSPFRYVSNLKDKGMTYWSDSDKLRAPDGLEPSLMGTGPHVTRFLTPVGRVALLKHGWEHHRLAASEKHPEQMSRTHPRVLPPPATALNSSLKTRVALPIDAATPSSCSTKHEWCQIEHASNLTALVLPAHN